MKPSPKPMWRNQRRMMQKRFLDPGYSINICGRRDKKKNLKNFYKGNDFDTSKKLLLPTMHPPMNFGLKRNYTSSMRALLASD